jgi:DNA-binding GntR family transcriptional regulator
MSPDKSQESSPDPVGPATKAAGRAPKRPSPQQLSAAIRDQVIAGVLTPGQRVTEEAFAAEFGTSRIPIREALRLLEADGFVRVQPYYGTFVVELSDEEAADLLEIRGVLEPLAASRAANRRSSDMVSAMREIVTEGRDAAEAGRLSELPTLNTALHGLFAEASGSTILNQLIGQLRHKIAWVYSIELPRRAADSWVEHDMIVDAIERGDADSASALMLAHIRRAEAAYRRRVAQAPDSPAADSPAPDSQVPDSTALGVQNPDVSADS